jgi:RNA polymerase sigma factor (sigma-70 family)
LAAVPSTGRASDVERETAPEADATRALYERHAGRLYAFCLHRLGSREEAEDAVQTTFLNAFRGLRRGVVPEAESAWLFKIAENVCLTRRRSTWRRGRVESPSDMQALQDVTPARETDGGDELIPLGDALAAMPETQRRAILLREWQGLSYKEIAAELDMSQAAVETLIFRARRSLANALETPWQERRAAGAAGRRAFDLGSLLATLKTLFAGGAAAKVAAVAVVAATGTAALAVADARRHGPPPRVEPSAAAARAPDSAAPRALVARERLGPSWRKLESAADPAPKAKEAA